MDDHAFRPLHHLELKAGYAGTPDILQNIQYNPLSLYNNTARRLVLPGDLQGRSRHVDLDLDLDLDDDDDDDDDNDDDDDADYDDDDDDDDDGDEDEHVESQSRNSGPAVFLKPLNWSDQLIVVQGGGGF